MEGRFLQGVARVNIGSGRRQKAKDFGSRGVRGPGRDHQQGIAVAPHYLVGIGTFRQPFLDHLDLATGNGFHEKAGDSGGSHWLWSLGLSVFGIPERLAVAALVTLLDGVQEVRFLWPRRLAEGWHRSSHREKACKEESGSRRRRVLGSF